MVTDGMGILAEPGRPESIAAAIDAALDRTAAGTARRSRAAASDRYGAERIGRDFAAIYEEALERKRR